MWNDCFQAAMQCLRFSLSLPQRQAHRKMRDRVVCIDEQQQKTQLLMWCKMMFEIHHARLGLHSLSVCLCSRWQVNGKSGHATVKCIVTFILIDEGKPNRAGKKKNVFRLHVYKHTNNRKFHNISTSPRTELSLSYDKAIRSLDENFYLDQEKLMQFHSLCSPSLHSEIVSVGPHWRGTYQKCTTLCFQSKSRYSKLNTLCVSMRRFFSLLAKPNKRFPKYCIWTNTNKANESNEICSFLDHSNKI